MHKFITTTALLTALGAAAPAAAQEVVYAPPLPITSLEARDIAASNGVIGIRKMELDEGLWKIEGRGADGARVEMKIDRGTGAIVELERYY
jgi:hypothetical protein